MTPPAPDPLLSFRTLLEKKGYTAEAVDRRVQLARRILHALDPADTSDRGYRLAVDRVADNMADPASIARCKQVAREFFPCLVASGRHVPATPTTVPPPPETILVSLSPHQDLDDLIQQALAMKATAAEKLALKGFTAFLEAEGLDRDARERRLAIARMLLMGMRGLKADGRHYRALIERLLTLFTRDETRSYFLGVARDFYPYCLPSQPREG